MEGINLQDLLSEILELFSIAENKIKIIEHLGPGLTFPAVNQLRYVANHLLRACTTIDENFKENELREAKYNCQRAIYDASEIGIVHLLKEIKIFQEDYKAVVITDVVTNYLDIRTIANKASEFIFTKNNDSATNEYQEATELFEKLNEAVNTLTNARPELNKKIRRNRFISFLAIGTLIASIIGLIISLLINCIR